MAWKRKSSNTSSMSREQALLGLAKLLRASKKLRPSVELSIRTVVRLLIQAERDRDEAQERLDALIEDIRNNHDVKYLHHAKKKAQEPSEKDVRDL